MTRDAPASRVELRGVSKRFRGRTREAVIGIELAIEPGERFVLVGPSGSGKTTLLRLIAGLERPTTGSVRIGGVEVTDSPPRRRGVGVVFQRPSLLPHLTVLDNLTFGLRARGLGRVEAELAARMMAKSLGIGMHLARWPAGLSGGEAQRVAIGRAVLPRPAILLLDEPFSGLDPPLRAATRAGLLDLHARTGGTMILVTHDQAEAMAVGDRIAVLREGRIEVVGPPRALYDDPPTRFVASFLGDPPASILACRFGPGSAEVEGGGSIALSHPRDAAIGQTAWLGVRPEAVVLDPSDDRATIEGVVRRVEPRGSDAIAWVAIGPGVVEIAIRIGPDVDRPPGARVRVAIEPSRALWFRSDPGETRL